MGNMKKIIFILLVILVISGCRKVIIEDPFVIKLGKSLNVLIEDIHEGLNYFHAYVDDIYMELIVIRESEDTFRTAFNTCERCFVTGKGYFVLFDDGEILCYQCKMPVAIESIGLESSGCNPIPIPEEGIIITEDSIQFPYETLSPNAHKFINFRPEEEQEIEDEPDSETEADSDSEAEASSGS